MSDFKSVPLVVQRLYQVAFADSVALLALIFIAVPLKRLADFPWLVKILGPMHGVLFITLIAFVIHTTSKKMLKKRLGTMMVLLAFIPFGAFVADYWLKQSFEQSR